MLQSEYSMLFSRSKQIQITSEEEAEDEEDKSQSSNEVGDEDIEDLLAPHEQTEWAFSHFKVCKKTWKCILTALIWNFFRQKYLKADEKPKGTVTPQDHKTVEFVDFYIDFSSIYFSVICRNLDIFQAAKQNPKTDEESDSDDHFYN